LFFEYHPKFLFPQNQSHNQARMPERKKTSAKTRKAKPAKATHGGPRPNSGRPLKETTLEKREFERAVHGLLAPELPRLIANLLKLADGVTVQEKDKDGTLDVFTQPPDREANKYLLDRLLGKPRESIEHSGSEGAPIPLSVEHAITRIYGEDAKAPQLDGPG
jgi:hypothetical protein